MNRLPMPDHSVPQAVKRALPTDDAGKALAPAYAVHYREDTPLVLVQGYSLDGRPFTTPPRKMTLDNLPLFLFKLVDAGYNLYPAEDSDTYHVRYAYSGAFIESMRLKYGLNPQEQTEDQSDE